MPPYSTLEVQGVESHDIGNDEGYKEVIANQDHSGLQVIYHGSKRSLDSPQAVYDGAASRTRRICGLPKRNLYLILVIGLFVIIGAVAGGVAGGLSSRHLNNDTQPDDDANPDDNSTTRMNANINVLNISKLGSSNRTDSDNYTHRAVFFQDIYGAIVAREWDGQSKTWATNNVTDLMKGTATPLNPLPGTPLASMAGSWGRDQPSEVHIYFLTLDSYVSGMFLHTPDAAPNTNRTLETGDTRRFPARSWRPCGSDA